MAVHALKTSIERNKNGGEVAVKTNEKKFSAFGKKK
jgi:hypothetical protein